ncbi:hypothetical protein [Horticoccus sp. 23ND18S-11]|uniref:hypothetical protein n=1 Tax=Horticoccus sp. 23ND18S-11 TaxID=3391832 RepID=UPI0039C8C5FA
MACTIDHLRPDHAVRVICDFTDARGKLHRAGETGIIRQMGLDTTEREIWIDWEQTGASSRLHFSLGSTSGPRNGHMREYFELGGNEPSAEPPPSPPPPPPPPKSARAHAAREPLPAETRLGEVAVACDCDPALHRAVLIEYAGVNACMRCGTVTCSRVIGDDGRHTGNAWHAYVSVAVPPTVLDWLAPWPRVAARPHLSTRWPTIAGLERRDLIYLPADARCETAEALAALEADCRARRQRPGFPKAEPPDDLPRQMAGFAQFWAALQLTPQSDLAQVMALAQLQSAGSAIAVEHLLHRADAFDVMVTALSSPDPTWQSAGIAMAWESRPVDPRLADVLIDIMSRLPLAARPDGSGRITQYGRFEDLFVVIAELKLATPEMIAALKNLQRRLVRLDVDLVSAITSVLRELHGEPPTQPRGPWLP